MGEFEISCKKAAGWAQKMSDCCKDMKRQEYRAADVLRQMQRKDEKDEKNEKDENGRKAVHALCGIVRNLHRQQEQMKQCADVLETIVRVYDHTETDILEQGVQADTP